MNTEHPNVIQMPTDSPGRVGSERALHDYRSEETRKRTGMDLPFLFLTLVLLTIGVVMVLSASFASAYYTLGNPMEYFANQTIFALIGIIVMLFVSRLPISLFKRFAIPLFVVSIFLLGAVLVIGSGPKDVKRWINLGFTTFQPSEIVKLAEVLLFALMVSHFGKKMRTFKYGVLPFVAIVGLIGGLLALEPHYSAFVIAVAIAIVMMFAGGTRILYFIVPAILITIIGAIVITKVPYAANRISAWLHPENDPLVTGFQILQSLYAIGSGGLLGEGIGQGRQKYLYLPEEHNDYIFSVVCEELGYIGAILILLLFALLIVRGFWLALHARDRFSSLVVTGLTSLLAIQVFLNVAVVTNLLPSTGISLPFFSSGGTALLIQLAEMGIILSVSRDIPIAKAG